MTALVVTLAVFFAVAIPWAMRRDRAEYHIMHGPNDGCPECEGK